MTLAVMEADAVVAEALDVLRADTGASGVANTSSGCGDRIFQDSYASPTAPPTYPYAIVSWLAAIDLTTADATHVMQTVTILVKITDRGSDYRRAAQLAARVAFVLDGHGEIARDGVWIVKLRRSEAPSQPADFVNGQRLIYRNQTFVTEAEPA